MLEPAVIAAIFAIFFAAIWSRWGGKICMVAATSWAIYAPYEYMIFKRVLCSGECDIRVDLLLFYPILAAISVAALVALLMRRAKV